MGREGGIVVGWGWGFVWCVEDVWWMSVRKYLLTRSLSYLGVVVCII